MTDKRSLFDDNRFCIWENAWYNIKIRNTDSPTFRAVGGIIMSNSIKRTIILSLAVVSCIMMAIVETIIEPSYLVKSVIKAITFLFLPTAILKSLQIHPIAASFSLRKKNAIALLFLGAIIYLLIMGAYALTRNVFDYPSVVMSLSEDQRVDSQSFLRVALYISLCNSFLEEYMFRFISFMHLSAYASRRTAYLFSAIMFALYHVAMVGPSFPTQLLIVAILGLAAGGLIFDFIDAKSGNFYPSWIVHMFADFALMTIWYIHI